MKRRTRIIVGNALALPLIGLLVANRLTWKVTAWVDDLAGAANWVHFRADNKIYATCKKLAKWTYAEKDAK